MFLKSIFIYPVKSLCGIDLKEAKMQAQGLQYDRRWMLLDENGKFLTQRDDAKMTLIKTSIDDKFLNFKREGFESFRVPLAEDENQVMKPVEVWDDKTICYNVGAEVGEWFSDVLKQKCSLIRIPSIAVRQSTIGKHEGKQSSFADSDPVLVVNETSLAELNSRLEIPVPMNRFRGNFVVETSEAWEEDYWKSFQIGDVNFEITKPCGRCPVIMIDQETGKQISKEPLKTLAKYRKIGEKVLFGMRGKLVNPEKEFLVKVGDEFSVVFD